jgi:membrane fusion protein (multidrug efflux system)
MLRRSLSAWERASSRLFLAIAAVCLSTASCKRFEGDVHAAPPARVHVETVGVASQRLPTTLPVTGSIEAIVQTELAANATGKVLEVFVQRGDEVKKGAVLVKLDARLTGLLAAQAQAQSKVTNEQAAMQETECERSEKLAKVGAIPLADFEKQQAQCKVSQSSVAVSRLNAAVAGLAVTDGLIRAPFDGFIDDRFVEVGQYVMPSTKVATMVSLDVLKLTISVPEMQLGKVHKDLEVAFHVGPLGDRAFTAKVVRVSPTVRVATRDVLAEAEVVNTDRALRPGMFAKVDLPLGDSDLPTVPKSAIVARDGASHVFVVSDGRIDERAVQLGPSSGDDVVVTKGVVAGERVVRKPTPDVKNGLLTE